MNLLKYKVVSDSMTPLIPVGAELDLEKIDESVPLKKFDIVVFVQNNQLMCHYVWHVNETFDKGIIRTRGLKHNEEDEPFHRKLIVGKVKNYRIGTLQKLWILFKNRNYD